VHRQRFVRATGRHDDQHHTCSSPSAGDRNDDDYDDNTTDDNCDDDDDNDDAFEIVRVDHVAATDDMRGRRCIHSLAAGMACAV
jgi:hypothetical protein